MSYFLKKTKPSSKGEYLQIYSGYYIPKVGKRNKSYKKIGYVQDLIAQGIENPVEYYQKEVDKLNAKEAEKKIAQITDVSTCKYVGQFLVSSMIEKLNVKEIIKLMNSNLKIQYDMTDLITSLICAQIVSPGSKLKAFEKVIPSLYGSKLFSYDQIIDGVKILGNNYEKYIELFNNQIAKIWPRNTKNLFFDCTNYYFEIDLEDNVRKKGPSKENRKDPIIGQALLLDSDQIPIGMTMYPGNQSEKQFLRKSIEDLKNRYNVKGKTVQVADKGLNCGDNIYAAVVESHDGYIFSKSVHGTNLNDVEKKWVLLEDELENKWTEVRDEDGKILYKYKSCVDEFEYKHTVDGEKVSFKVKEKRIVTYNPTLARKQKAQIKKEVSNAEEKITLKGLTREEFGDCVKYVSFTATDKKGQNVKIAKEMNNEKIEEDLSFAGFNLLVTSEIDMNPEEIYNVYHGLWRIEDTFRVMKTYLEARPVFLQLIESIYGHFLICYLGATILRLLELKVFEDQIPVTQLIDFIRDYRVTETGQGSFINNASSSRTFIKIKDKLGLIMLGNLILQKKDIDNIFSCEL